MLARESGVRYIEARPPGKQCQGKDRVYAHESYEVDFESTLRPAIDKALRREGSGEGGGGSSG